MEYVKTFENFNSRILRQFDELDSPDGVKRTLTSDENEFLRKYYSDFSWSSPGYNGLIVLGGGMSRLGEYYITEEDLANMMKDGVGYDFSFNEELSPDLYIRAGQKLKNYKGKRKRAGRLIDRGHEEKFGFYKVNISNNCGGYQSNKVNFTDLSCEFTIGYGKKSIDELIESWKLGESSLFFTYIIYGIASEADKISSSTNLDLDEKVEIIKIMVYLCDSYHDETVNYSGTNDYFENEKVFNASPSYDQRSHIFSDRRSAYRFKKLLKGFVDESMDTVNDLFSILGGDSKDIEKYKSSLANIPTNSLYDDEN